MYMHIYLSIYDLSVFVCVCDLNFEQNQVSLLGFQGVNYLSGFFGLNIYKPLTGDQLDTHGNLAKMCGHRLFPFQPYFV